MASPMSSGEESFEPGAALVDDEAGRLLDGVSTLRIGVTPDDQHVRLVRSRHCSLPLITASPFSRQHQFASMAPADGTSPD